MVVLLWCKQKNMQIWQLRDYELKQKNKLNIGTSLLTKQILLKQKLKSKKEKVRMRK